MSTSSAAPSARIMPFKDPGWEYGQRVGGHMNAVKYDLCNFVSKAGIHRHKLHLVGGSKDVTFCSKVPKDVQDKIRKYIDMQNNKKKENQRLKEINMGIENINVFESGSNTDLVSNSEDAMSPPATTPGSSISNSHLIPKVKGPLDNMFAPDFDKLKILVSLFVTFFYENGFSFNVANSPSFTKMLSAVGQFGPDFKGPRYHELRVSFLKKKVLAIREWIDEFKVHWKNYGCSIMCGWWTDGRRRTLINFLVNFPQATVFLKSIDGSPHIKVTKFCHEMLVDVLAEVVRENVIQIVTDNAANLKLAGGWIQEDLSIYWTPCAAQTVTRYIYNHVNVLEMMRRYTGGDLTRPVLTRFATCCLSMENIYTSKRGLWEMMFSEEWANSKWGKSSNGNIISFCLKVYKPLVNLIRMVDVEEKPAMGYIYHAVDQTVKQIPLMLSDPKDKIILNKVMNNIRERWAEQLHQPLHAAGYYLNPSIYFSNPPEFGENLDGNADVKKGLYDVVAMLYKDEETQDKIINQLLFYRSTVGLMGQRASIRNMTATSPVEWWINWGSEVPELQRFAKRVLGLTVSRFSVRKKLERIQQFAYQENEQAGPSKAE
ncbi:hypothetical protein MKX01_021703 [Papaver californicum]|nr:hypothetical protein MKX01_021703 [Papaver californicum]